MSDDNKKTDPVGIVLTQEDVIAHLMGSLARIEAQLASGEPPPWAAQLIARIENIEKGCWERHQNGHFHKQTTLW